MSTLFEQVSLQRFRKQLPKEAIKNKVATSIEFLLAPYEEVLQTLRRTGLQIKDCLPAGELQRAKSFYLASDRQRFIAARILLRIRLSQMALDLGASVTPTEWELGLRAEGKPYLCGPLLQSLSLSLSRPLYGAVGASMSFPHFNLAHSADYVAVAISREAELGIDLEAERQRQLNISGISKMLFCADEQQELEELLRHDALGARRRFFELWCHYEALSKLEGTGLLAKPKSGQSYGHCSGEFSARCGLGEAREASGSSVTVGINCPHYYWTICWRKAEFSVGS